MSDEKTTLLMNMVNANYEDAAQALGIDNSKVLVNIGFIYGMCAMLSEDKHVTYNEIHDLRNLDNLDEAQLAIFLNEATTYVTGLILRAS